MNRLILPDTFLQKLGDLAIDYQKRSGKELKKTEPSLVSNVSTFFGEKDVNTRVDQIEFINNWRVALKADLKTVFEFKSEEEISRHINGLGILYAVCNYIEAPLNYNLLSYTPLKFILSIKQPVLITLLNEARGLQKNNVPDTETAEFSIRAAKEFIEKFESVETANKALGTKFSADYWNGFVNYVNKNHEPLDKKQETEKEKIQVNEYPVASIMMPLIGCPCEMLGTGIGYVTGKTVGKSAGAYAITAVLGSGLIFTFSVPASIALVAVAPTFLGNVVDTCFGITTAQFFGSISKVIGQTIGLCVGGTVDLVIKLLDNTRKAINHFLSGSNDDKLPPITGLMLGKQPRRFVNGIELKVVEVNPSNNIDQNNTAKIEKPTINCDFSEEGLLIKNGENEFFIPHNSEEYPELQILYKKINEMRLKTENSDELEIRENFTF